MKVFTKPGQWMIALGLVALAVAAAVGLYLTRDSATAARPGRRAPVVDEKPLQTAREIAKLASNWEEQRYAQQILRLADHEVDLAFASAMRDASEHPVTSPEAKAMFARVRKAEQTVTASQQHLDALKKQAAAATGSRQDNFQQQISIVQAQLELDQDELDDARGDQLRSGLDPLSRIQRQFNRHQATQQAEQNTAQTTATAAAPGPSLFDQVISWKDMQAKKSRLFDAQNEANQGAAGLNQLHDSLDKQVASEQGDKQALTQEATAQLTSSQDDAAGASGETTAALFSLHTLAVDQKDLGDLDKRIQDHQELSTAYGNWIDLVRSNQLTVLHHLIRSVLWIVIIVLVAYVVQRLIDRFLPVDQTAEQTRFRTLRIILRFSIQAVGLLLILLVIFGAPNQTSTILGLATAGLTVALKDFIVAFIGWFVLMGRNGIRVGDWVEINGVVGEVIEVSLLRTVLLETGNWTDTGHPTGRKVAFMNGFAIEGHFFNFSTAGQWLWDELDLMVPSDQDLYPVIESIQKMVVKETEADSQMAEQEWQHATSRYKVKSASATPAVNLRPTGSGVEVHVRYITRARERYATRARLYQALVELLRHKGVETTAAAR